MSCVLLYVFLHLWHIYLSERGVYLDISAYILISRHRMVIKDNCVTAYLICL